MQNQMTNGGLLFYIVPMQSALWRMLCVKRYPIPYLWRIVFYQRKEIKDVLCLRLVLNPKDEEALMRVINYPARGIGNTTIEKIIVAKSL
jgi:DNA helicase-2/ATP-dependent DNA helicase PcrA